MICHNCLKSGQTSFLIEFNDAYSCPRCYIVSDDIVFGSQLPNPITTFSPYNVDWTNTGGLNFEKFDDEIVNACNVLLLSNGITASSNKIFLILTGKKFKSSYSHDFYKTHSILKACGKAKVEIEKKLLCSIFRIKPSKLLKFQKYLIINNMGYLQPSTLAEECYKLLNILNIKNCKLKNEIVDLTLIKIKTTDINTKIVLLHVFCDFFKIKLNSEDFKKTCSKINVNIYSSKKLCDKLSEIIII